MSENAPLLIKDYLDSIANKIDEKIERTMEVIPASVDFKINDLYFEDKCYSFENIAVLFFDLHSSTQMTDVLNNNQLAQIYNIAVGNLVTLLNAFEADFIDIQGDGGFAIFWQKNNHKKALSAAFSITNFNTALVKKLREKYPNLETQGFKVGLAAGKVLVKKYGARGSEWKKPIWAGTPVNYAAKLCQQTTPGNILVTTNFYNQIEHDKYYTHGCNCRNENKDLYFWHERKDIQHLYKTNSAMTTTAALCFNCETDSSYIRKLMKNET